jgi:hypothetical protein
VGAPRFSGGSWTSVSEKSAPHVMGFSPGDLSGPSLALLAASMNIKGYVLRTVRNNDANPINNVAARL